MNCYILVQNQILMNKFFSLVILLFCQLTITGQNKLSFQQIRAINNLFEDWNSQEEAGLAIGIIQNQELLFAKGYGMSDLEHQIPFEVTTVADIGSVAKQFTCFGIVLLEQEGKLSFDDDIKKFLSYVPDFGSPITVRHLIHHTSGLREIYTSLYIAGHQDGDLIRQRDVIQLVKHQQELNFPPGEEFLYCNTSYALLAEIIEAVSGQSYEDFLSARIFKPLGMQNTYVMDRQGKIFPNCAESYAKIRSTFIKKYDNCSMYGQGGIYSTIQDMLRWLANYEDPKVGGAAAISQMLQHGILNSGDTLTYAFGLYDKKDEGIRRIYHGGASAGYRSTINWLPEQELGFILMSNRSDFNREKSAQKIIEILLANELKPEPKISNGNKTKTQEVSPPIIEENTTNLQSFEGTYFSEELKTTYTLFVQNGTLKAEHFRLGTFWLSPKTSAKDFFSSRIGEIRFERDEKKAVNAFRVSMDRVRGIKFKKINW